MASQVLEPTVHKIVDGFYRHTNLPNESREYIAKREELRLAEIENMKAREKVAAMRRALPEGPVLEDYVFWEGPSDLNGGDEPVRRVRLSELFSAPDRALIMYQMMYGKKQKTPCPMCTATLDAANGAAPHIMQKADYVVAAAADPAALRAHARSRGWNHLRLLSCGDSTFKYDLGSESPDGDQDSTISVFVLGRDGKPRLFYNGHPRLSLEIKERGQDLVNPIWNYLDLTPKGREDFVTSLKYPAAKR